MAVSPDILVNQLSENLANLIVDHLEAASISEPLIIVDLFYHYADIYFPLVSYLTIDRLRQPPGPGGILFEQKKGPIHLDPSSVEQQMDQLMELEWSQEGLPDIGRTMIRKTAAILNQTRLWGRIATHDLFGAFAVDGTVEGHSFEQWEEILTACGINAQQRAAWKKLGFY
jgi:hypothetical protein